MALLSHAQTQTPVDSQIQTSGGYACILTPDVFFYAQRDEKSGLFLLPDSYYVKVLDVSPDFCKIEYLYDDTHVQKLVGYAKTSQLTFVPYVPKRPYLYRLFDLHYKIENAISVSSSVLNEIIITCAYYGDYTVGSQTYCYVLREGTFGYVPKPADFTVERNTEYNEWLESTQPTDQPSETPAPQEEPTSSPAQIALLVAVCLLVPMLAAFLFRSPKHHTPYEEE